MLGAGVGKRLEAQSHLNSEGSPETGPGGVGKGGHCLYQVGPCYPGGHLRQKTHRSRRGPRTFGLELSKGGFLGKMKPTSVPS